MSHWKNIGIDMECSIEVLRRILIGIMPKWESYLKNPNYYDPSGNLVARSHYEPNSPTKGCSIVIPMGTDTGVHGADMAFIQVSNNKWTMRYDYKPTYAEDLDKRIKQEYATIRTREEAKVKSLQIISDEVEGSDNVIRILVPSDYMPDQIEA